MAQLLASVGAYTGLGVLVTAGVVHLTHPRAFPELLAHQVGWPAWLARPVGSLVIALEVSVGLFGVIVVLASGSPPDAAKSFVLYGASALYGLFSAYGAALLRWRPSAPCGCSRADHPVNLWIPMRAIALGMGCLYAAVHPSAISPWSFTTDFLVVVVASATFVVLGWNLPSSLAVTHPSLRQPSNYSRDPLWTSSPAP